MCDLFDAIKGRDDFELLLEATRALEELTGKEVTSLPEGPVAITSAEAPHVLQDGERVVFYFGGAPDAPHFGYFEHDHVVIAIFSREAGADALPVCCFTLLPSYKERGDLFTPLLAVMGRVCITYTHEVRYDSAFYRYLAGRHERAAVIFSHMWRLQRGPMVLGNDGRILGTVWS